MSGYLQATQKAFRLLTSKRVAWLVIAFGAALRAAEYVSNSALYVDEGALALNVIHRSFGGLLAPLDFNQASPPGFLALEKIVVAGAGSSEYALRLFPFACSIAALILFQQAARRVLSEWGVPVALLFFAVSEQLIYFGAQVKQYSSDVAVTIVIVLVGIRAATEGLTGRDMALLALVGVTAVWVSHPSVFVLAGVGTTLAAAAVKRRQRATLWKVAFLVALWLASFGVFYTASLAQLSANQRLESSWLNKGTFMPLLPTTLTDAQWFFTTFLNMFSGPADLSFPAVAGLSFITGCLALLRRSKAQLLMLTSPLLFALLASGLHKYPFGRRLLLFAVPLLLLVIVSGIEFIIRGWSRYSAAVALLIAEVLAAQLALGGFVVQSFGRLILFVAISMFVVSGAVICHRYNATRQYAAAVGGVILFCLLLQPVGGAARGALKRQAREDVRPVLAYVSGHRRPGDLIYVYHHQRASFLYYAPRYGFNPGEYILGEDRRGHWIGGENEAYLRDLEQLRGRRVWLVFSYVRTIAGANEEDYIVRHAGRMLEQTKLAGASAYLCEP